MTKSEKKETKLENLSFEEAFKRLEETVQKLEDGGLTLKEATLLFEDGMKLARICNEFLSSTELKITRLQTAFGEQMRFLGEDSASGR